MERPEWILDGAAVRVQWSGFDSGEEKKNILTEESFKYKP